MKRQLRAIALDPQFAKRGTRAFVCGGMAGTLVMHEKGWLGHKESLLHSNEGTIWSIGWKGNLIAWANDLGVKIYDTYSQQRITYIERPPNSPRADLFKCTLHWEDETTLLIAWADHIKLARIRTRPAPKMAIAPGTPNLTVEIAAHFQVDCMISGIVPYFNPLGSFLFLAYIAPDTFENEATQDLAEQRRKAAHRPELRIITRAGEELSADALSLNNYHQFGCNDYHIKSIALDGKDPFFVVVSPKNIVLVRPRDAVDHVEWLVEHQKYEEALAAVEKIGTGRGLDVAAIGKKYIEHLVAQGKMVTFLYGNKN
jgi:vacuolar protein sorting-associated protein 41